VVSRELRSVIGKPIMSANETHKTSDRSGTTPQARSRAIRSAWQIVLAVLYLLTGAILSNELLTNETFSIHRRIVLIILIGLMLFLVFIHLTILRLILKRPN
jgi:hypothetical protein